MVKQLGFPPSSDKNKDKIHFIIQELIETRNRLKEQITDLSPLILDFSPDIHSIESIGTLLLHIAGVEWSWIFEDIFKKEMDYETWKYAFALREKLNPPQIKDKPLDYYMSILDNVRSEVLQKIDQFSDSDLKNEVLVDGNKMVSLEFILYHLINHESIHIGQINLLKRLGLK